MNYTVTAVPVAELNSGNQLFRCAPYNCAMLARSCVTRQSQADSAFPPAHLMLCKGCELGREVKRRATDVQVDPHAAARASRKHIPGVPARAAAARVSLPIIGLESSEPPAPVPEAPWKPWANRVLEVFDAEPSPYVVACARCRLEFATDKALGAHHVHCPERRQAPPAPPPPAFTTKQPPAAVASETIQKEAEGPMAKTIDVNSLIGKEMAGVKILRGLPSEGAGQLARVRFPCGHEDTMLAFLLNSYAKNGQTRVCKVCKTAKSKTASSEKPTPTPPAPRAKERKSAPRKGAKERPARLAPAPAPARALSEPPAPKVYEFPLRRDFGASVTLPVDLTMYDVERLTRWLETLVFEEAPAAAE